MNEGLKKYIQAVREYLSALTTQKKIALAIVGTLIAAAAGFGIVLLQRDPFQVLYSDLQGEDTRAVARKLGELNIPYQLSEDQKIISVPSSRVYWARMQLAKEGIPGQEVVGFEKFDSSTLGMSSYVQRIQYVRAVQGELVRSIQNLASVKRARVHISLPPKKTFMEDEEPPKASVVLELKPGQSPSKSEINGIAHLMASAVEGLKVSEVTIVDTRGNFLHQPNDNASSDGLSSALLEMQRGIEGDYEKRITELLTPVVGLGKVRAKVTAEIDPSRVNTTEENYDPEKTVVKNSLKNGEVTQGQRPNPLGIPGSRSNLPGTEVQNPPIPMATSSTEKNTQQQNFMVSKKIQTTDKPSGNIKRLTVAVVVDGYYNKGANGAESFSPRPEEELRRLQEIVGNAVGYDAQRRDSITVSSLPFHTTDFLGSDEAVPDTKFNWQTFMRMAARNLLIGFVILLFFLLVLRPFLKWATLSDVQKEINQLPRTVAELEAVRRDEGLLALSKAAVMLEEGEPLEKKEEAELRTKVMERLDGAPKKGSRIIQEWIEEEVLSSSKPLANVT